MHTEYRTRWIVCIAILILFIIPYSIINHLPFERKIIELILGEENIPFLPWTFVIYLSVFPQAVVVIRFILKRLLRKVMAVASVLVSIHLVLFIIYPIEYPRVACPDNNIISIFHSIDNPGNCFPSLHVSMTLLFATCFLLTKQSVRAKILMWIWTLLITASVLTTKQHYLIDIFAALLLTGSVLYASRKNLQKSA